MNGTILVVDDSATTRLLVRKTIRLALGAGQRVLEADNGRRALEVIAAEPVDLVLTDLHMPQLGGVELIRTLLADPATARIPILVLTAEPRDACLDELRRLGVAGCLRKPFRPEDLRDELNRLPIGAAHA